MSSTNDETLIHRALRIAVLPHAHSLVDGDRELRFAVSQLRSIDRMLSQQSFVTFHRITIIDSNFDAFINLLPAELDTPSRRMHKLSILGSVKHIVFDTRALPADTAQRLTKAHRLLARTIIPAPSMLKDGNQDPTAPFRSCTLSEAFPSLISVEMASNHLQRLACRRNNQQTTAGYQQLFRHLVGNHGDRALLLNIGDLTDTVGILFEVLGPVVCYTLGVSCGKYRLLRSSYSRRRTSRPRYPIGGPCRPSRIELKGSLGTRVILRLEGDSAVLLLPGDGGRSDEAHIASEEVIEGESVLRMLGWNGVGEDILQAIRFEL